MSMLSERLDSQSVAKSFFQYFIPTLLGMMLMSVNIVVDGIFVGNGVGSVALASVNVAVPVFSVIISLSLLIAIGGGTLYSVQMGEGKPKQAQKLYTLSFLLLTVLIIVISIVCYWNMERLARLFGADEQTLPYAVDYMRILFIFSLILAWENYFSIFVRNDGDPQLAMVGLVVSAIVNIALDYWMIFILEWEVTGAALATILATSVGLIIYLFHLFKKRSGLKFTRLQWNVREIKHLISIGTPSFLSEAGTGIFVIGYNIAMAHYAGTTGLAAFSVINYLHTFMFLAFIGIGQSIQPMISYYYGAKEYESIKKTVSISEITGIALGLLFLAIGWFGADILVAIFGVTDADTAALASKGIKLFFIGYLFMSTNFIYMTYYQSIGYVGAATGITIFRGFILLIAMLYLLPLWFETTGVWLALPAAEGIVALTIWVFARSGVRQRQLQSRGF